jgi:hypothetical protein
MAHPRLRKLDEPLIGAHLGLAAAATIGAGSVRSASEHGWRALDVFGERDDYFFSRRHRDVWLPPLRRLVLTRLDAQLRELGGRAGRDVLVIKEPHGSEAADLLSALTPESRLLVLVRDGRDVVDSLVDALRPDAWAGQLATVGSSPEARLAFIADASAVWVERMRVVSDAMAAHSPHAAHLVRYEDLLVDTGAKLRGIFQWLRLDVPEGLDDAVERLRFDNVADEARGAGRFHRAATPGLWRDNLSTQEQETATQIMGPTLARLGYDVEVPAGPSGN